MSDPFFSVDRAAMESVKVDLSGRMPTAEAVARAIDDELHGEMVYEPILVSPAQFADPVLMAALKKEFPRGRLNFRPRRR